MAPHPAVAHVEAVAEARREADARRIRAAVDDDAVEPTDLVEGLRRCGRLTVNFHPDRFDRRRVRVVEGLLHDGEYRSQFVTGISSGGRFAVDGGRRPGWERDLFGDVYEHPGRPRPIYGALDLTHDPHGGAPRFGSCALVLADEVMHRATFTVGDSHLAPTDIGTAASFTGVAAGLVDGALAGRGLDPESLLDLARIGPSPVEPAARDLDHYVEAQIHGGVSMGDVVAVLADPGFRDGPVGRGLTSLANTHDIELRWHRGSVVDVADIPDGFRGGATVALGRRIADAAGQVTAATIGHSAATIEWTEPSIDGDAEDGPLQLHKKLWHAVVALGRDAEPSPSPRG